MPIDTANKRRSAVGLSGRICYPVPDGAIGIADRAQVTGRYAGFAVPDIPPPPPNVVVPVVITRETIYAALFELASSAAQFVTKSRTARHWADVSPAEMPALFQEQGRQHAEKRKPAPTKWTLYADLAIYVAQATTEDPDLVIALNKLIDAVVLAIAPSPATNRQSLGGRVTDCCVNGDIEVYEGRNDNGSIAVAVIPVEIVTTLVDGA